MGPLTRESQPVSAREPTRLPPAQAGSLYLEYGPQLLAFATGLLRHRELAREVVQVTFGKALEHAGEIPPEAQKAWLFKVARNEALAIRRRNKVAERVQQELERGRSPQEHRPDRELLRREEVELIHEALRALPTEQQQVVRDKFFKGKTFAKIAEQQQVPLGTVLTRMRLALGKLEQSLKNAR